MSIFTIFDNLFLSTVKPAASDFVSLLAPIRSSEKHSGEGIRLKNSENHAFLAMDGSLVSFVRWNGIYSCLKEKRAEGCISAISEALDLTYDEGGGVLEWVIDNPADDVDRLCNGLFQRPLSQSKKKGIDISDIISSEVDAISPLMRPRSQIIAIWTPRNRLTEGQQERFNQVFEQILEEQAKLFPKNSHELASDFIQYSTALSQELELIHDTRVSQIINLFSSKSANVELLEWEDALTSIKEMAHPSYRGSGYKPSLAGSRNAPRGFDLSKGKIDVSSVAPPSLGWQIFSEDPKVEKDLVYYDGYWHCPKVMALGPAEIHSIESIIHSLPLDLPWRMRVIATPLFVVDGLKSSVAYMSVALPGEINKKIRDSVKELNDRFSSEYKQYSIQVVFDTWSRSADQARAYMSDLVQVLLRHGSPTLTSDTADLRSTFIGTLPGLNLTPPAPKHYMSTREVAQYFGGAYPAKLMEFGTETFMSDGHAIPVGIMQPELSKYVGAIIGGSGSGKSLMLNSSNLMRMMTMGSTLPYIVMLDITATGMSVANLIKERSGGKYEHYIVTHRFSKERYGAINPLDNRLGQTKPIQSDMDKLANFLTLYVQASAQLHESVGMRDMIVQILDHAYYYKSQPETANRYSKGESKEVDNVLKKYPDFEELFASKAFITWFEVVDFLAEKQEFELAGMANVFTSPLITELPGIFKKNQPLYSRFNTENSRHLIEQFENQISINKSRFPCFSYRTVKTFDNARVVMFDLVDVAPNEDPAMSRMFYSLALYIGSRNYVLANKDIEHYVIETFRPVFRQYWKDRILELRGSPKLILADEVHRTGEPEQIVEGHLVSNPIWKIIETLAAEMRKSYGGLLMASQDPSHFSTVYLGTHCSIMYLGGDWKEEQIKKAKPILGLDYDEVLALRTHVHGIKIGSGSSWMVRAMVGEKWRSFVGEYRKGAEVIWMLSTTTEDQMLYRTLTDIVGDADVVLKILQKRFPKGSAKGWIEELRESMAVNDELGTDVYVVAANTILEGYRRGVDALIA